MKNNSKVLYTLVIFLLLAGFSTALVLLAKGYTLSPKAGQVTLEKTGWILIKSAPDGAKTYLNDKLSSPTNSSLGGLLPDTYSLRIQKEGYHEWKKSLAVKAELVTIIDALLIKKAAEIKPITQTGVKNPVVDPTGTQIAYYAQGEEKTGLWVYTLEGSLFGTGRVNPKLVADGLEFVDLKGVEWSPDGSQILATLENTQGLKWELLLNLEKPNLAPYIAQTNSKILRQDWTEAHKLSRDKLITALNVPTQYAKIAAEETTLFSPDEKKFLYPVVTGLTTQYHVVNLTTPLPVGEQLETVVYTQDNDQDDRVLWHTTSAHLLLVAGDSISLMEIDGQNRTSIFNTNLVDGLVVPTPNGRNIIINTAFTQSALPNLHNIFFN